MPPDGIEVLARWREVGEWWANQPQREVIRYLDENGIRREKTRLLPPVGECFFEEQTQEPWIEDHREDMPNRVRKLRDEKVSIACGYAPTARYSPLKASADSYCALHVLSGYSFGRSSIGAADIPLIAASLGIESVLLADSFSLAGAVEFVTSAKKVGVKPLLGATLELEEGGEIVLVAKTKRGYYHLSHLVTECHLQEPRLFPLCNWQRLERHAPDLLCLTGGATSRLALLLLDNKKEMAANFAQRLIDLYGRSNVCIQIERSFLPWEIQLNCRLLDLADHFNLQSVAGHPITHAKRENFPAQDMMTCIESLCAIEEVLGRKPSRHPDQPMIQSLPSRAINAERFLLSPSEIRQRFLDRPDLVENTRRLADQCDDDVLPCRTQLPQIVEDEARTLREATYAGMKRRVKHVTPGLERRLEIELERIIRNCFAGQFLIAHDMCEWAKAQGILFSGRGSVVDSAVAYCLGISRISAHEHDLHFDRFLPETAGKRPDIDIDFEARRRDDVRNYLTQKYGAAHVATVAAVGTYCTRGIVREVGKVMGIPHDLLSYLNKRLHGSVSPEKLEQAIEAKPELRESGIPRESFHWVFRLAELMMDLPRNLRAHSSGVVISRHPIADTVPMTYSGAEDVRIIQWDKRSAKHYFDKFDILCLRGQDVLSGTQTRIRRSDPSFDVEQVSLEDEETYRTMRSGQLIGIPQSASPAMRQAHIRLRTENLQDASLVQAGIRPGVGGAVKINELIARRRGKPYELSHPELDRILGQTYGIIVFQEQVDQLLQTFGGYTSDEAEDIREAIHKKRREGFAESIREQVLTRMREQGFEEAVAIEAYELVAGFQGYGFAEGHALAFAEISVRSIWCQQNYPAEYFAALFDAQPAGYYGPCTLANEARLRNVRMLPPDVNRSGLRFIVEDVQSTEDPKLVMPNGGIRISLAQISGLSEATIERIVQCRAIEEFSGSAVLERAAPATDRRTGEFQSFFDFVAKVRPDRDELERLILIGFFDSLEPNRRMLLWAIPQAVDYADLVMSGNGQRAAGNGQPIQPCLKDREKGSFGNPSPCRDDCAREGEGCELANRGGGSAADTLPLEFHEPELQAIEDFDEIEKAIHERRILDLDIEAHLMAYERKRIQTKGGITSATASQMKPGETGFVVGNPIRLRFPPTKSGRRVLFFDLEDETGMLNVTCFDDVYQRDGHVVICSPYITLWGEAQDRDGHIAFLAHRIFPYEPNLTRRKLLQAPLPVATADFLGR